jgi:hypothetical protein
MINWALDALRHELIWLLVVVGVIVALAVASHSFSKRRK